jgi:hypothetical protein
MDRPWKSNYNSKCAITILEIVDINEPWALVSYHSPSPQEIIYCNAKHSFQQPVVTEREAPMQVMCFSRGSIVAQMRTDRTGYCPGEAIALTGGLCNHSSTRTKPVTVSLYQKTIYTQGRSQ